MEKRFALFLLLSAVILFLHLTLQNMINPPRDAALRDAKVPPEAQPGEPPVDADDEQADEEAADKPAETDVAVPAEAAEAAEEEEEATQAPIAPQRVALGSLAPGSPYRMLVTLDNRGAAIERIELSQRTTGGGYRFRNLDRSSGYLGHLALRDHAEGGCVIQVVGDGTPAAVAQPEQAGGPLGLRAGDIVRQLDDQPIRSILDWDDFLSTSKVGQSVRISVSRSTDSATASTLVYQAQLTHEPLGIVEPEYNANLPENRDPLSFLLTLRQIGDKAIERGDDEIDDLPSLREGLWEVQILDESAEEPEVGPGVEFRKRLTGKDLQRIGVQGGLEVVKRYRLARTPAEQLADHNSRTYHLTLEIEIRNLGEVPQQVAYQLDGANGLPLEGWWYSNKTHPRRFSTVGARDIVWHTAKAGHNLIGAPQIYADAKKAAEKNLPPHIPLFASGQAQSIDYVGVDAQYFSVALLTDPEGEAGPAAFEQALALPAGPVGEKKKQWVKTTNTTFRLDSPVRTLKPDESFSQRFTIFAGPKQPELLEQYGLQDVIAWGWFWMIAQPLSWILHFFAKLPLVNYGLAIILLTVLVRSAMMPLSYKATKNAHMMQQLAPEMKRIAEKYKNEMDKRAAAQRELFAKHNYNPFGGCLLMFIQLPIFIGLYRALSVDIELLQAPLIAGMSWCSNLAGPDMLWYWEQHLPDFFADPGTGWLGPYFNILPMVTVVLFLVQQKMFMPPATDDQTRMQQQMMKFMMIFMGVLFFRVPSGLCVYFIASSMWGIAERKLLPQHSLAGAGAAPPRDPKAAAESEAKKARIKKRLKK